MFNFLRKRKRGIIENIEVAGGELLNNGIIYKSPQEVIVLEETDDMYKVKFRTKLFQQNGIVPKWWKKEFVKII